jgi:hypothetical protein
MNDSITLKLSSKEMDYIGNLLGERPFKEVAPLIANLQQQIQQQQKEAQNVFDDAPARNASASGYAAPRGSAPRPNGSSYAPAASDDDAASASGPGG